MYRIPWHIFFCLLTAPSWAQLYRDNVVANTVPVVTERRLALVIGNQNYSKLGSSLENPHNDADDVADALDFLGFTVLKFKDLDRVDFERTIDDFERQLKDYDVGLVYFSGHGLQAKGENFLVPTDAVMKTVTDAEYQCVKLSRVFSIMEGARLKVSLVLLDACRDAPIPKGVRSAVGNGLLVPNNPPGSFVCFATRAGGTADDNSGQRNGLFTYELLKHLREPNLGIRTIMDRTITGVRTRSGGRQIPGRYDELEGDFVFVKTTAKPADSSSPKLNIPAKNRSNPAKSEPLTSEPTKRKPALVARSTERYLDLPFADMVYIPGGTFQMGDVQEEGDSDERPAHEVTLSSFLMGKYEVTQGQWEYVMGSNPSQHTKAQPFSTSECSNCPVEQVSWTDVREFLKKLNTVTGGKYRLPTEAEWEYAAGGGMGKRTRFGNGQDVLTQKQANYDQLANPIQDFYMRTMQVGSFLPNSVGLHDMAGNVFEWCNDWSGDYISRHQINPTGPSSGTRRIVRGGSYSFPPKHSRVTHRSTQSPSYSFLNLGFRIVAPAP